MADSFELNRKINGDTLSGSDLRENDSFITNQIFVNAELASRTSSTAERYFKSTLLSNQDYATGTCFQKGAIAFPDAEYDYFDDGAVDADIWSITGTVTEESTNEDGYLFLEDTGTAIADDTGNDAIDFKDGTAREILVNFEIAQVGGTTTADFQISDGTNHVSIAADDITRTTYRIVFDKDGDQCRVYTSLTDTTASVVDLSGLGANWYVRFAADATGGTSVDIKVYGICVADGSETSTLFQTSSQTIGTADQGIPKVAFNLSSPVPTLSVSFNAASNFTDGNKVHNSYTSGTDMIAKITGTGPASIGLTSRNIQSVTDLLQIMYD